MSDQLKTCCIEGCNEPTFKHFARCHAHQREQWSVEKKKQFEKNPDYVARQMVGTQKAKAIRLALERGICDVEGCGKHRAKNSVYCASHRRELTPNQKPRYATTRQKRVQVVDNTPILADLPRLVVIDTKQGEYIEYAPVKRVKAKSSASLRGVETLMTSRAGWVVLKGGGK